MPEAIESLLAGGSDVPAARGLQEAGARSSTPTSTTKPTATSRASGPARPPSCSTGPTSGTRSSSGTSRSRSGSSAGSSTPRTTASTDTSRPGTATRSRSTGRASRATRARSPTRSCSTTSAALANALKELGVGKGDRVEHLPRHGARAADGAARVRAHRRAALGRVRRLLRPTRSATASTTPRRRCSSPATAPGDAAPIVPLKETADDALAECPIDREGARAAAHRAGRRR